jgi:predicted nucleic-acid-binding protein
MTVAVDTNVLVRATTEDDERQTTKAQRLLEEADFVAIGTSALCELVWVLSRGYRLPSPKIAQGLRQLIAAANVTVDRHVVEAGLAHLDAGGDFADGVIAYEGRRLGADTFISFDKRAVRLLADRGQSARLL